MTYCPTCGHAFRRSDVILPGRVVLRCVACDQYRIDGDEVVIGPCARPLDALRTRADAIDRERREHEMQTSSIDDPRWERLI